ncbi:MAG TPA: RsmG family class I SAM-dependent methyltransferase [Desulfomonilia bacterium]
MNDILNIWIREIIRFNKSLHLVGPQVLKNIEKEIDNCLKLIEPVNEDILADLGTGSGIPGIPFAVMHPGSEVILIERSEKKCTFLRHSISCMGLKNAAIVEADPLVSHVGKFPAVISRAFSPKDSLVKIAAEILQDNGKFYYMASDEPSLDTRFQPENCINPGNPDGMKIYTFRFNPWK